MFFSELIFKQGSIDAKMDYNKYEPQSSFDPIFNRSQRSKEYFRSDIAAASRNTYLRMHV
jgi:hypothetical protein